MPGARPSALLSPTRTSTLADARQRAKRILPDLHEGIDPRAGRPRAVTLRQTLESYLEANRSLSERSRSGYRKFVEANLKKWLDRPLREITRHDIERRHAEVAAEVTQSAEGVETVARRPTPR